MRKTSVLAAVVLSTFSGAIACDDATDLDDLFYTANLSTANVLGPIILPIGVTPATGVASVVFRGGFMTVNIVITDDLTSGITGAQLRGPASTLENGDILFDFGPAMAAAIAAGATTGTVLSVDYDLTDLVVDPASELRVRVVDLVNILNSGLAYVNVASSTNPNGELRGQMVRTDIDD